MHIAHQISVTHEQTGKNVHVYMRTKPQSQTSTARGIRHIGATLTVQQQLYIDDKYR